MYSFENFSRYNRQRVAAACWLTAPWTQVSPISPWTFQNSSLSYRDVSRNTHPHYLSSTNTRSIKRPFSCRHASKSILSARLINHLVSRLVEKHPVSQRRMKYSTNANARQRTRVYAMHWKIITTEIRVNWHNSRETATWLPLPRPWRLRHDPVVVALGRVTSYQEERAVRADAHNYAVIRELCRDARRASWISAADPHHHDGATMFHLSALSSRQLGIIVSRRTFRFARIFKGKFNRRKGIIRRMYHMQTVHSATVVYIPWWNYSPGECAIWKYNSGCEPLWWRSKRWHMLKLL